jgi:hypothetical protein
MYAILIKEKGNLYRFLSVKKEIMKETTTQVTDPDTNEVKDEVTLTGTGEFETVKFEVESRDELEAKCVELLGTYNKNEFLPVNTEPFQMDLIWDSESETETV